jgi:hypothetical protein
MAGPSTSPMTKSSRLVALNKERTEEEKRGHPNFADRRLWKVKGSLCGHWLIESYGTTS